MAYSSRPILDCMPTIGRSDDDRFPASVSLPIVDALAITVFVRLFLDNIFAAVVTLLVLLSALLVFALLLGDVEAKTYEYGMLRALGMRHSALVQILLMKSTLFSIGGISTGLLCAWLFNLPVCMGRGIEEERAVVKIDDRNRGS
jgi:ABC-type antimicrobial peptide transport system permease subunit